MSSELGRFQSGQMGRTVNPLSFDFRGSNPLLPTVQFEKRSILNASNTNCKFFKMEDFDGFITVWL